MQCGIIHIYKDFPEDVYKHIKMTSEVSKKKLKRVQIILLGDHLVGKTSILRRFVSDEFTYSSFDTLGIDFVTKNAKIGKDNVVIKMWDTAGQERFHNIASSFYKQCQGVLVVFDVGSKLSFENIKRWLANIRNLADPSIIKYLIGNKIDIENRDVMFEEADLVAKESGMKYFETSAKNNIYISEAILGLATEIYEQHAAGLVGEKGIRLQMKGIEGKEGKGKCC